MLTRLALTYAECEVLQKTFVFLELITEIINTDTVLSRLHGILVQSSGEVINLPVKLSDLVIILALSDLVIFLTGIITWGDSPSCGAQ